MSADKRRERTRPDQTDERKSGIATAKTEASEATGQVPIGKRERVPGKEGSSPTGSTGESKHRMPGGGVDGDKGPE